MAMSQLPEDSIRTDEPSHSGNNAQTSSGTAQTTLLGLPLELREYIFAFVLQDLIVPGPCHPYDESLPRPEPSLQERLSPLTSLQRVCRQFNEEANQVFKRDIAPNMVFHFFNNLQDLVALHRKVQAHPYLREARFYLRSQIKETGCANDFVDDVQDTFFESQEGCELLPYEEDPQVIANWILEPSSPAPDVEFSKHWPSECGCQQPSCVEFTDILYKPLAKSLRLLHCAWIPHGVFPWDEELFKYSIFSILKGRLSDLDFDRYDDLARKKYRQTAEEYPPPTYWTIYRVGDMDRAVALQDELINVGSESVVESQKEHCGIADD